MRPSAVLVILLALAPGCRCGTLSPEEFDRQYPIGRLTTLTPRGMRASLAALRGAIGTPVRVTSVRFTEGSTSVLAQAPRAPTNYDTYVYREGEVHASPLRVDRDDEARYRDQLFELDRVPLDRLPGLAREALTRLPLEGARVTLVSVDKGRDGALEIEVSLESERRRGRVVYDERGGLIEATER